LRDDACVFSRARKSERDGFVRREKKKTFCVLCVKKNDASFDFDTLKHHRVKKISNERVFAPKTLGNNMLRKERELCYKHRDAYYEALSSSSSSSNNSKNKRELKRLKKLFEKHCPSSWVEHFEKIRLDQEKFANLTKEEEKEKS
jgi:hypothetical protein